MIYFSDFSVTGGGTPGIGALVYHSTNEAVASNAVKSWNSETYDGGYHDTVTNNSRLTVLSGVSLARVTMQIGGGDNVAGTTDWKQMIYKNGASFAGTTAADDPGTGVAPLNVASAIVSVSAGDYFTSVNAEATSATLLADGSWFAIEQISSTLKYALVQKSGNQSISGSTITTITFDTEVADTDAFHDNVTNNSRLTVPSGVSLVRVSASLKNESRSTQFVLSILKNGSAGRGLPVHDMEDSGADTVTGVSAILAVTPGDYFEVQYFAQTTASTVQTGDRTWFQIEEVPSDTKYAVVYKSASQSVSADTATILAFGAELADTDAFHDNSTNNSRLTVPSGCTRARLSFNVKVGGTSYTRVRVIRNGVSAYEPGLPACQVNSSGADNLNAFGAWVDVTPGDYFELEMFADNAQTPTTDNETWFCIEAE